MATTFSQAKSGLDAISNEIQANRARLTQIQSLAANAADDLSAMATKYATLVTDIDAAVTAAPTDRAFLNLKADKDKLATEFDALLTKAQQFETAVSGITF